MAFLINRMLDSGLHRPLIFTATPYLFWIKMYTSIKRTETIKRRTLTANVAYLAKVHSLEHITDYAEDIEPVTYTEKIRPRSSSASSNSYLQ